MKLFNKKLVSVYIPTHNRASLVVRAVESVLCQTYSEIEIIVVDDGSEDNTFEVLRPFIENNKIVYLKNELAKGAPFSRNRAIAVAKGYLITGLDDDDYFLPERIKLMVDSFDDEYSFISTGYKVLSLSETAVIYAIRKLITLDDLLVSNIAGNQVLVKTNDIKELGGFDVSLPAWQDYDMWIRLARTKGAGLRISEPLYVVDKSHPHERISTNINKINLAFKAFIDKHPEYANKRYFASLKASVIQYNINEVAFNDILKIFLSGAFKRAIGLLFMKIKAMFHAN